MAGKKKIRRNVPKAIAHINASFNNTIVTIAAPNGESLCWDSAGTSGFGSVANMGAATNYQFWYRDPSGSPCSSTNFNFSNAWTVTYQP